MFPLVLQSRNQFSKQIKLYNSKKIQKGKHIHIGNETNFTVNISKTRHHYINYKLKLIYSLQQPTSSQVGKITALQVFLKYFNSFKAKTTKLIIMQTRLIKKSNSNQTRIACKPVPRISKVFDEILIVYGVNFTSL